MSRLVTPNSPTRNDATMTAANDGDGYLDRVAKYVPTEIVAGYIALNGAATGLPGTWQFPGLGGIFLICLILTPVYLYYAAKPGQPKRLQITISVIAFVIWAYAVGGASGFFGANALNWHNAALASILLVLFSLISGAFAPKPGDK